MSNLSVRTELYCRMAQADPQALAKQKEALLCYAELHHLTVVGVTEETGSGSSMHRGGLHDLLRRASEGAFDVLLMQDLSRLGRNMTLVFECMAQFKSYGVEVRFLDESADAVQELRKLVAR